MAEPKQERGYILDENYEVKGWFIRGPEPCPSDIRPPFRRLPNAADVVQEWCPKMVREDAERMADEVVAAYLRNPDSVPSIASTEATS